METLELTAVIVACAFVLGIGAVVSFLAGRKAQSGEGWHIAGRNLPLWVVVLTQFATATGGGVLVAHVGNAYNVGWAYWFYPGSVLLGFILLAFIGSWLRREEFTTVPEILRRLYVEHPLVTVLASLAAIVVPFGWLATQYVAFASLFSEITGASPVFLTVLMGLITLIFVLPGGLASVAWSDAILGLLMLTLSVVVVAYTMNMAGGWQGITENVPNDIVSFPEGLAAAGAMTVLLWVFSIVPGTLTNQMYYQRVFATRDIKKARLGLILGGFVVFIGSLYPFLLALSTRAVNDSFAGENSEMAAGWILTQLPVGLLALFAAFLLATIATTTSSALQSVVTNVVHDITVRVLGRARGSDTRGLSRIVAIAVMILAAILAIAFPAALAWLVATYAYSASILAAPIFIGYFLSKRGYQLHAGTAIASMIAGLVGCASAHILNTTIPYAIFGMMFSAVALIITHLILTRHASERPMKTAA